MKRTGYECDICGKYMGRKPDNLIKWKKNIWSYGEYISHTEELCNDCVKAFLEWYKAQKKVCENDTIQRSTDN